MRQNLSKLERVSGLAVEIEAPKPVESLPRPLVAPELVGREVGVVLERGVS